MNEENALVKTQDTTDVTLTGSDAGAIALVNREKAVILASMQIAKMFPRNELTAAAALMKAMERPSMAAASQYRFPRGKSLVKGPSIKLAQEAARLWGNLDISLRVISVDDEYIHLAATVRDLETNTVKTNEAKIKKLIQKRIYDKKGNYLRTDWTQPDDRELRELVNKNFSFLERNAVVQIIPRDITEDACEKADKILKDVESGKIKSDKSKFIRALLAGYMDYGVTQDMLEAYLGHPLEEISADEAKDLRQIKHSVEDGNSKVSEYFTAPKKGGCQEAEKGKLNISDLKPKEKPATEPPAPAKQQAPEPTEAEIAEAEQGGKQSEAEFQETLDLDEEI